jgi:hypothetical protein
MRAGHCLIIRFVLNLDDLAVAAGHSVDLSRWRGMFDDLMLDHRGEFPSRKGLAGLDEHQVRHWTPWYRWVILAMLAPAFLSVTAVAEHTHPPPPQLIPLPATRSPGCSPVPPIPGGPLVHLAPPPPVRRPRLPLPPASRSTR